MRGDRYGFVTKSETVSVTPALRLAAAVGCLILLLFYCGCAKREGSKYYILYPMSRSLPRQPDTESSKISIGLDPVMIPGYLKRPQIVTRTNRYEVDIAESDRWADTLGASVSGVIAENLSSLLGTDRVFTTPWQGQTPNYEVRIKIIQFDGTIPGNVKLFARWSLLKNGKATEITRRKYRLKTPIAGQGYPGLVSAMSLALYDMSHDIADAIVSAQTADEPAKRH